MNPRKEILLSRNAHMVDLLRPTLTFDNELRNLLCKRELTEEDFDHIIENSEMVKKAATEAKAQRFKI